jgi:Fe-S cluster assembly protein SufD
MTTTAALTTQFAEAFKARLAIETYAAIKNLREEGFAVFSEIGFPTVKHEDWKYTNVSSVVSDKWEVDSELRTTGDVPIDILRQFNFGRNGFAALNLALGTISIVRIAKDTVVEQPIELSFGGEDGVASFPHTVVIAESGCKATLIETYASPARSFTNAAVQIVVEDNANLTHYRVQKESADTLHYGVAEVALGRGSRYDSTAINIGAGLARHDIDVKFTAEGAEAWVDGLYMLSGTQHSDTHSVIDHTVPNCTSHQNYKGVLNDKSRGVFNGKVFVRENAHGTDAQQSNKNLLLSNDARIDTKPQLEIFNDDVKCSHGATVGQLEEEELFYLLTRGLPEPLARNLLTYGFAEEIINKIGIEGIKAELDSAVLNRLGASI